MSDQGSADYWAGYLGSAIRQEVEAGTASGSLARAWAEYESSAVHRPREIVGFAVVDATGDCYAIRETRADAESARADAGDYLFEASSCGHSMAVSWVEARLPLRILAVDAEERDALLDNGTPILDREP